MSPTETGPRAAITSERRLGKRLRAALPRVGAVSTSAFDRAVSAVDASHYLLTPRAVVTPTDAAEVARLFAWASASGETLTFRSGGTSLSGQGVSGGIQVDTRRHFRSIEVLDDGMRVRVGPGATVRQVNARLLRHGRKLGPDPASEIACTIGGVVANNSSGMACGVAQNTYQTLASAVIVLPSGTIIDSGTPDADRLLREAEPELFALLGGLRARVAADSTLTAEIARQFRIKNTMGYSLNAISDHETPVEILAHLMVGSEGTLGFIAEATFNTVPLHPHAATALLVFDSLRDATGRLVEIIATGPATVELMDASSLRAARLDPASRSALPAFEIVGHCALLVEYQAATPEELDLLSAAAAAAFRGMPLRTEAVPSSDAALRADLWHVRKGLYATIAGSRPSGTTALLEDIAVPVERLSDTCAGLTELFRRHGYGDAVIFGHAKDGNVHFLLTEDFGEEAGLERYRAFTENMVDLILAAGGSLKAEHGTGRIMAPFVARQYGPELYGMMREIKAAFDPAGILSPDTILTDDPVLHLRHLKSTPTVESEVDRCVDCGYCEPVCPSKDLTTTPRQRIAARRAIADAARHGDTALAHKLIRAQEHQVIDTCAVDGMCQTACPVRINTGDLVRRLRSETVGFVERGVWNTAARDWGRATVAASRTLSVASRLPAPMTRIPNTIARGMIGADVLPLWSPDLPGGGARRTAGSLADPADAVHFPACVGAMFGSAEGGPGVAVAFASLAAKAGLRLARPEQIGALCCGTPWKSKGILDGYHDMATSSVEALWRASDHGRLPVVCDTSSCTEGLVQAVADRAEYQSLHIRDAVGFTVEHILPRLEVVDRLDSVVVHPTCSSTRAGANADLLVLAGALSDAVTVPDDWNCCAFAGDRGMLHPELTSSATRHEAREVVADTFDAYVSCNRTCEIAMTRATGRPYHHILEILDRSARSR